MASPTMIAIASVVQWIMSDIACPNWGNGVDADFYTPASQFQRVRNLILLLFSSRNGCCPHHRSSSVYISGNEQCIYVQHY